MTEQFTDKEILDEFIRRFDFTCETAEDDYRHKQISLRDCDGVYLGNITFAFNKKGQFINDLPIVKLEAPHRIEDEIYSMDYDSLIYTLGEIVDKLRNS